MATISVIVPVYKVEPYLRRCVDSILAQTYTDFELILVDDGSPDNCGKICDEYAAKDNRIHVIHQANGGLSAARNTGIDWATNNSDSRYITFIDSDDWIAETCLSRLYEGVMLGAEISIVGLATAFDEKTIVCHRPDRSWKLLSPEDYWITPDESKECSVTKLYAKPLFLSIRFPVGRVSEEVFTTHKLVFAAKHIAIRGGAYYMYLRRAGSITTKAGEEHKRNLVEAAWAQYEFIRDRGFVRAAEFSRGRACHFMLNVADALHKTNPKFATELTFRVDAVLQERPLAFWDNRNVYRRLRPWRYRLQWPFAMMWNLIRFGKNSWIIQDLPPILKLLSIERKQEKHPPQSS